ncbi:MAG: hypothetical protein Q7Q73_06165 [Verrucomicrobiota bacterium JB024]|nr:hypothetical protein [Verrucomicrobiota bacterium JB024]
MKKPDSFTFAIAALCMGQALFVGGLVALALAFGGCHPEPVVTPTTPAPAATFEERYPALPDSASNLEPIYEY